MNGMFYDVLVAMCSAVNVEGGVHFGLSARIEEEFHLGLLRLCLMGALDPCHRSL